MNLYKMQQHCWSEVFLNSENSEKNRDQETKQWRSNLTFLDVFTASWNRAILRPPLTFSATLYRFSMEALWELRVLSTQPTTLRCQYVEVYTTTARPQRTSAKLLLSIMLNFYSGLLNKYITTDQQTPVRIISNFVWGNISQTFSVSLIHRIVFLKVCMDVVSTIFISMLGRQRRGAGG